MPSMQMEKFFGCILVEIACGLLYLTVLHKKLIIFADSSGHLTFL